MTSKELLKEIEAWLSFNTEPSREETAKLRKSIKDHLTEQSSIHDVSGRSEQLICDTCKSGLIDYPEINRRTCSCGGLGYNVTD